MQENQEWGSGRWSLLVEGNYRLEADSEGERDNGLKDVIPPGAATYTGLTRNRFQILRRCKKRFICILHPLDLIKYLVYTLFSIY